MMHNEDCEAYKMNTHHRQSVEEIRPGKTQEEEVHVERERNEGEV